MFQKPAFGANTSGFGMSSTFGSPAASTSSPFGGFKPATQGTFGAPPAFGAGTSAQPAPSGGLFGATNTTGGLFGATGAPAAAPAFGAANTGFGFGANATSGGGLFNTSASGGLFQPPQSNAGGFGAKPAGFGFGGATTASNTSGGLFGNTQPAGGLFGQQPATMSGGGLFANNTAGAFGASAGGTAHVKYSPLVGTDVVVKGGASQNINIKHHCITCMKEYEGKSLEELRLEDYAAGRKGAAPAPFGFSQQENKPLFGATSFGAPASTSAGVFGAPLPAAQPGFGQTGAFSFGGATQANTNTTTLFGAQKPAFGAPNNTGTSLFGAAASTPASTFGTNTSTFGFGSNMQNQSTGGLFGAKPATSGFGAAPASTGFGSFGAGGGLFGAKPLQTQAPTFGAPQTGVGTMAGGFGTNTSTSGGLFGGASAFGKPAASQPSFGFGAAQPTLGLSTGLGASAFGQSKPAGTGFGALGGGMFPQQPANTFRTGLDSGLGGGMFGNNSSLGGSLGMGLGANNSAMANLSGASAAGNVHEQILALAARPYGDSPLFKDLLPDNSTTAEDVLKPTNPQAQAAILARAAGSAYRVTSPPALRLALRPRAAQDKKSLFDGLEESDASLEDKLSLKPSRKRLVLRPNQRNDSHNDSDANNISYRSQEENGKEKENNGNLPADKENNTEGHNEDAERVKRNIDFPNNNNFDMSSERQASWLNSSKRSWTEKEPVVDEPTTRLYPNLDKDIQSEVSERRSSWLTTKTLRKPQSTNPESAENSVRELGVRPRERDTTDALSGVRKLRSAIFYQHISGDHAMNSCDNLSQQIKRISVSDDEPATPRELPPHPSGVKCTRPGYYTIPTLDEMTSYLRPDGTCKVPHLTIGRTNYGNVYFDSEVDVAGLDIDALVHFLNKEVIVYPEDLDKPPVGQGLNRRAVVTLDRVWPRDKTERRPIDDPDRLLKMDYEGKLRRVCDKHDTKFIEYRPQTGSWVFRVEHFSKYGLTDSDEEDEPTPDVLKRQLVSQTLQKNAAPLITKPLVAPSTGLGGLGLSGGGLISSEDSIFAMQQSSINLLSGASKAFEMDTTEENMESHSLYQDNTAFCVKSPTSELARLEQRQSAHVQLMKASLYAEPDMEDDVSVSTGDQLVPLSTSCAAEPEAYIPRLIEQDTMETAPILQTEEIQMMPLLVQPHTIVLRYHRKIPPFKHTIAGRLGAACMADMSVSRARHSRVGFGPAGALVYAATHNTIADLPNNAELSELSKYVSGRGEDDWSEPVVARLALGRPGSRYNVKDVLSRHLENLFEYSTFVESGACPRLQLLDSPRERYAALQQIIRDAETHSEYTQPFGVSGAYCLEVWKLCDALWGADLENDGVPGTDNQSIVLRHRRLLGWLSAAVAELTDTLLRQPTAPEPQDECDGHSARVWTLLLGGRLLEACRVAREHGDLNMAALIAQAAGDPSFRSLLSRQLTLWRECGADRLVSSHRLAALELLAASAPREMLREADWRQALLATAKYLCPQVPSLEQVVRRYEAQFAEGDDPESDDPEGVDLTRLPDREMCMRLPLPPYAKDYDVTANNGSHRRELDLRYTLIRARAFNTIPEPRPASCTPDPLDYSLCFVLGVWSGRVSAELAAGAAAQLEAAGAWHRAVHALAYIPDDRARAHLIREVLARHAPASADSEEMSARLQLVKRLRVPEDWLLLAQAHRAKYEHRAHTEATRLAAAGRYNAAHEVLVDQLLPEAVLSDSVSRLAPLLDTLGAAARRNEVDGWERGGAALAHYAHVCEQVRKLVSGGGGAGGAALDALRPAVAAACRALEHLPPKTAAAGAARAEMGARLVQLAAAGGARGGGGAGGALPALLRALRLPPDTVAPAQLQITTELAEQASELCIEPSPVPI